MTPLPSSFRSRIAVLVLTCWLAACGTVREWREVRSGPATRAQVYDAVEYLARTDGFMANDAACDRGLGLWASRWRYRQIGLGRPGRYRLSAEVLVDEGNNQDGWIVRFFVEQQRVDDLRKSNDPEEDDWDDDGQDLEREALFAERLRLRLGRGEATGREPVAPRGGGR